MFSPSAGRPDIPSGFDLFAFPWVGNNKKLIFPHNPTVGEFDIVTMDNNNITFKILIAIFQN